MSASVQTLKRNFYIKCIFCNCFLFFSVHRLIGRHSFGSFHVCVLAQTSSNPSAHGGVDKTRHGGDTLDERCQRTDDASPVFPFLVLTLKTPRKVPSSPGASMSSGRGRDDADAGIKVGSALCVRLLRGLVQWGGGLSACLSACVRARACACI